MLKFYADRFASVLHLHGVPGGSTAYMYAETQYMLAWHAYVMEVV